MSERIHKETLLKKLEASKMIQNQIERLNSEKDLNKAINMALASVGDYTGADRAFIYEERDGVFSNTFEWCSKDIEFEDVRVREYHKNDFKYRLSELEKGKCVVVSNVEEARKMSPDFYKSLSMQNIWSTAEAPIMTGAKLTGYIGVENAPPEMTELIAEPLMTLGAFIGIAVKNSREHKRLMKSYETILNSNDIQNVLVNSVGSGIFAYTLPERNIIILNSEAKRLFDCGENVPAGHDFEEMMNTKIFSDDLKIMRKAVSKLKNTGNRAEYTFRIQKDSGEVLSVKCDTKLLRFSNGQKYILSAMSDVTKREILEENLIEERKQYRDALTMNSDFFFSFDLTDGTINNPIETRNGGKLLNKNKFSLPLKYETFTETVFGKNNVVYLTKNAEAAMSSKKLAEMYAKGVSSITAEYYIAGIMKYCRIIILISESKLKEGHLTANFIAFDNTGRKHEEIKNRAITESLTNIYNSVYHAIITENICEVIKSHDDDENKTLPSEGNIKDFVNAYVTAFAEPRFKKDLTEFLDPDTLDKRFSDADVLTVEYRRKNTGWCRGTLAVSGRKSDGSVASVIFAVSVIEKQKQKELEAAREIKQQWFITKSFSGIYFTSWAADLENDKLTEINVPEFAKGVIKVSGGSPKAAFKYIADNFAATNYKDTMSVFLDTDTLKERMENRNVISCEYLSAVNGWCRASFISLDDGTDRYILAIQKIGEEKEKEYQTRIAMQQAFEAARNANSVKTDFLAVMSRDIRSPINSIVNLTAEAGKYINDAEKIKDSINKINITGKHLLGLINETLDMSGLETGNVCLQEEEFTIPDLIDELVVLTRSQIKEKKHTLSVTVKNIEHESVIGNNHRIQQVFVHLMNNAVKYTHDGGRIKITVSEKPFSGSGAGSYEFIFEDNGIGMSREFQEHLFEPFERAPDANVSQVRGAGLGLSVSRSILQMLNGDISVKSELGKGTSITVKLILKTAESRYDNISLEKLKGLPVLIADNDRVSCETACQALNDMGLKSEWTLTGREAVARACDRHKDNEDFYAIILYEQMSDMDGLTAAKEIRANTGDKVPAIVLSAYDLSEVSSETKSAGINTVISKPFFKSRFVRLFAELSGDKKAAVKAADAENPNSRQYYKGRRALIVEDDILSAEIAGEILGMRGITAEFASDGKQAADMVAASANNYYDMVFMDIQMPNMNGYASARAIRAMDREYTRKLPIIAMTSNAFAEDVKLAAESGMNAHVAKPLDMGQLSKILKKWL